MIEKNDIYFQIDIIFQRFRELGQNLTYSTCTWKKEQEQLFVHEISYLGDIYLINHNTA
jgi:hypothetical protein